MAEKTAFFDVDGPIVDCILLEQFTHYLDERHQIDAAFAKGVLDSLDRYRGGTEGYFSMARNVNQNFGMGVQGHLRTAVIAHAREFAKTVVEPKFLLPYAKPLLTHLKAKGFTTVAIGGTYIEILHALQSIGFDTVYGSRFETTPDGKYTGVMTLNLALFSAKRELLESYIQTHDVDLANSIAFGDTEQDNAILERVGHPVALNPQHHMAAFAKHHDYAVIKKTHDVLAKVDEELARAPRAYKPYETDDAEPKSNPKTG